jgi:hypothetical protein
LQSQKKPHDRDREDALRKLFDLQQANQNRTGSDAVDKTGRYYELKSTTRDRVSTAREIGPDHLEKWRRLYWIFGRGCYVGNTFVFEQTYSLTPVQMAPRIDRIEPKVTGDDVLFSRALSGLDTNGFTSAECDRVQRAYRRGVLLNHAKNSWGYVQAHGVEIMAKHSSRLRKLLNQCGSK